MATAVCGGCAAGNDSVFDDDGGAGVGFVGAVDNLGGCFGVFCLYEDDDHGVVLSGLVGRTSDVTGQ